MLVGIKTTGSADLIVSIRFILRAWKASKELCFSILVKGQSLHLISTMDRP